MCARRRGRGRQKGPSSDTRVFVWRRVVFVFLFSCLYRRRLCGRSSSSCPELDRDAETLASFLFVSSLPPFVLPSAASHAGCVSGLAPLFSSHNPPPPPQRRPVRRLQNKMVLTAEGARALRRGCRCAASPPSASDGSHYEAFGACFMSVGVGCPSSPLPSSFVWWFEGVVRRVHASLHAYMCVRVCVCAQMER